MSGLKPQTVLTKVPFISDLLHFSSQSFIALTETWLNEHKEAELKIQGYTLYRQDRKRKRTRRGRDSGGVAIYLNDEDAISAEVTFNFSNGVIEALGLHIKKKNLVVIIVYRQPDSKGSRSTSSEFKEFTEEVDCFLRSLPEPTPDVIICGDFNLPKADWKTGSHFSGATVEEQKMIADWLELLNEHFLIQQITGATHRDGNTLDLLFVNNSDYIYSDEA